MFIRTCWYLPMWVVTFFVLKYTYIAMRYVYRQIRKSRQPVGSVVAPARPTKALRVIPKVTQTFNGLNKLVGIATRQKVEVHYRSVLDASENLVEDLTTLPEVLPKDILQRQFAPVRLAANGKALPELVTGIAIKPSNYNPDLFATICAYNKQGHDYRLHIQSMPDGWCVFYALLAMAKSMPVCPPLYMAEGSKAYTLQANFNDDDELTENDVDYEYIKRY